MSVAMWGFDFNFIYGCTCLWPPPLQFNLKCKLSEIVFVTACVYIKLLKDSNTSGYSGFATRQTGKEKIWKYEKKTKWKFLHWNWAYSNWDETAGTYWAK